MNHIAVHISQPMIASLVSIGELFVINTQTMKNGGMQIVNMNPVLNRVITEIVRVADHSAGLDASTAQPG